MKSFRLIWLLEQSILQIVGHYWYHLHYFPVIGMSINIFLYNICTGYFDIYFDWDCFRIQNLWKQDLNLDQHIFVILNIHDFGNLSNLKKLVILYDRTICLLMRWTLDFFDLDHQSVFVEYCSSKLLFKHFDMSDYYLFDFWHEWSLHCNHQY